LKLIREISKAMHCRQERRGFPQQKRTEKLVPYPSEHTRAILQQELLSLQFSFPSFLLLFLEVRGFLNLSFVQSQYMFLIW
jgi:hypothetical protein